MDAPVNDKVDVHVFCLCVFKLDTHQKADLLLFDFCRCKTCFCSIEEGGVLLCLKRKEKVEKELLREPEFAVVFLVKARKYVAMRIFT